MKNRDIGTMGEEACAVFLRKKKYKLICGNYRTRFGEIDIIAQKDDFIIFVEFKTRAQDSIAQPGEFVDPFKQSRLLRTAMIFLNTNKIELQPRFDVMEVVYNKNNNKIIKINHIENAFGG